MTSCDLVKVRTTRVVRGFELVLESRLPTDGGAVLRCQKQEDNQKQKINNDNKAIMIRES